MEVDRYIVWPGQALAYKMGELRDRGDPETGRGRARRPRFDVRRFHNALLDNGPVPLEVLQTQMDDRCDQRAPIPRRPLPYDWDAACAHLRARDKRLARLMDRSRPIRLELAHTQSLFHALAKRSCTSSSRARRPRPSSGGCAPSTHRRNSPRRPSWRQRRRNGCARPAFRTRRRPRSSTWRDRTASGELPTLAQIRKLTDDEVVERLTVVRGIGPWTVHMLLMFRLGRPDVLPVADYGVRKGFALTYRKKDLPTRR